MLAGWWSCPPRRLYDCVAIWSFGGCPGVGTSIIEEDNLLNKRDVRCASNDQIATTQYNKGNDQIATLRVRGARLTAVDGPAPGSNVTFPVSNSFNSAVPLSQHRTAFYANVSRDVLRKLVQLYKVDYELFDYDYRWACDDC